VTEAKHALASVTGTIVADDAISSPKIAALSLLAKHFTADCVQAGSVAADTITARELAALAVTAGKLAANAVTAGKIDAGAVTADKLAAILAIVSTIQSPNYSEGQAGFRLDGPSGSAEFNDLDTYGYAAGPNAAYDRLTVNDQITYQGSPLDETLLDTPGRLLAYGHTTVDTKVIYSTTDCAYQSFPVPAGHAVMVAVNYGARSPGAKGYAGFYISVGTSKDTVSGYAYWYDYIGTGATYQQYRSYVLVPNPDTEREFVWAFGTSGNSDGVQLHGQTTEFALEMYTIDLGPPKYGYGLHLAEAYAGYDPTPKTPTSFRRYMTSIADDDGVIRQETNMQAYLTPDYSGYQGTADSDTVELGLKVHVINTTDPDGARILVGYRDTSGVDHPALRYYILSRNETTWIVLKHTELETAMQSGTLDSIIIGPTAIPRDNATITSGLSGDGPELRASYYE
jgi:hypothetical protein